MDPKVRDAIEKHSENQRRGEKFPLDEFVRISGEFGSKKVLNLAQASEQSLFSLGVLYYQRVRLDEYEKKGYYPDRMDDVGPWNDDYAKARAIAKQSPVVMLDEATSALDGDTSNAVLVALNHLTRGKTVVSVTHRLETLTDCSHIYRLEGGKLYDA